MPIVSMLLQLLIPMALLGWLIPRPMPGRGVFLAQATGIGVALVAIARVGMWIFPPWWFPWLLGAAWVLAVLWRLRRMTPEGRAGPRWRSEVRAGMGLSLVLLLGGGWAVAATLASRGPPSADVIDIPNPLGAGSYLVAHGGRGAIVNPHLKTLDPLSERFKPWRGQSYALDLVGIDRLGLRAGGVRPVDPSRYVIFGAPIFAPCQGRVIGTENGLPDLPVPRMDREHMLGNHVLLQCDGIVLVFAHLREGSVLVEPGVEVTLGQRLGEVGNSGNTSEPHLHIHAQRPGESASPIAGDPVGLQIDGRWLVRNDRIEGRAW
jgi:hypothetical protein